MDELDFKNERAAIAVLQGEMQAAKAAYLNGKEETAAATQRSIAAEEALELLQHLAQLVEEEAHKQIAEIVSHCLSVVFADPYRLILRFERKRSRTEACLRFERRGLELMPLDACGGGMVDVAAFALRVACLILHRPALSRLLVIDEGFKFVSAQYRENIKTMLEGLSADLGVQIVQVTHIEELETGRVIEL